MVGCMNTNRGYSACRSSVAACKPIHTRLGVAWAAGLASCLRLVGIAVQIAGMAWCVAASSALAMPLAVGHTDRGTHSAMPNCRLLLLQFDRKIRSRNPNCHRTGTERC
jgi:hypothetical protein